MSKTDKFEQMLRMAFVMDCTHWSGKQDHVGECCLCDEPLAFSGNNFCRLEFGEVGFAFAHLSCAEHHPMCQGYADEVEGRAADADPEEIWEGSIEQLKKALDFLEVVVDESLWFMAMYIEDAPPEKQFRVRRATPDEVAS